MSIVRMRKVFRSRTKVKVGKRTLNLPSVAEGIFVLIIVIFVAGAYYTFGGPAGGGGQQTTDAQERVTPVVARVNGEKVTRQLYELNLQMRQQGMSEQDITQERYLRSSTLSGLIDAMLMRQACATEKIKVTSAELDAEKTKQIEQMISSRFPEKKALVRFLKKEQKTLDAYKKELREKAFADGDALREQVMRDKLQKQVESKVTLSDAELAESYSEVKASHILIDPKKEAERAKPAAAQPGQAAPPAVDGDAAAKKKADDLLAKIKQGADFAKLARENSDDPGSGASGGDLGFFKRDMMVKEFADAAFKLQAGQVSEVVKSDFGYHIIKVTGRRKDLPKDFEKNKATLREQVLSQRKSQAWSEYQKQLTKDAKIEVLDPELAAYRLLDEGKAVEGQQLLEAAVERNSKNPVALWELAVIYDQAKKQTEAIATLEKVTLIEEGARNPMVHMKLGDLYLAQNNKAKAMAEFKDAFDRGSAFTMQNFQVNMQVEMKLKELGDTATAAQVTKWLDEFRKEQMNNPMGGMGMGGPMGNFQFPPQ